MRLYGARWRARGDHSPLATPRQQLRSFYTYCRARRTSSSIWLSLLRVFALALRLSFETRFVSAGALLSTRRFLSAPVSALLMSHLCLGYASRSSRATSTLAIV